MEKVDKERAGVIVGSGMGGITAFSDGVENLVTKGYRKISPFCIPHAITNTSSAMIAMDAAVGFRGPNYSISTACATSNHCFHSAADQIRLGRADVMVAGGTEAAIIPIGLGGFVACRALSQRNDDPGTASRPWDKDRDGFVMGEGAGILVMESLEHAMRRDAPILAEYLGGAVNSDAYHMTNPRPDGCGVSVCIRQSLENAGVTPEEVNYINAHATSTPAGDLAEVNALKQVFKDPSRIKLNATKSMIGHSLGAAGGLEAIATIKAITTGWVHPTINQFNPEPEVDQFNTVSPIHLDSEDKIQWWYLRHLSPNPLKPNRKARRFRCGRRDEHRNSRNRSACRHSLSPTLAVEVPTIDEDSIHTQLVRVQKAGVAFISFQLPQLPRSKAPLPQLNVGKLSKEFTFSSSVVVTLGFGRGAQHSSNMGREQLLRAYAGAAASNRRDGLLEIGASMEQSGKGRSLQWRNMIEELGHGVEIKFLWSERLET
ncbi:3-oxoacyl-[acyl-carrier-protein] synthase I, chloroplastic [Triticum urartu]|uniref:beta-ketoacyl-[acyl-carrier-protein] synthase I n=1 Tax=Triticum urartu TaxID=4572 RepID=M7ZKG3_TRIUA|nr:3-oxoacyl-[acyl-carrier-protein] synthase I, chloroplastic [Triticum urartu]